MNDPEKIDFAALDPSRDPRRWEQLVGDVARRGLEARRAASVTRQLVAWARPALAAAALVALVVWLIAALRPAPTAVAAARPADALTAWAWNDELPATATILETLGADDVRR
jgi:hypothetical protein